MSINNIELTRRQREKQEEFRDFVDKKIMPISRQLDEQEEMFETVVQMLINNGYWGSEVPLEYGGAGLDSLTYGLLNEEIGRGCANIRNLIGVQGMVTSCILRWGNKEQRRKWLPLLSSGKMTAAFALTEPEIGSDAKSINTTAKLDKVEYVLNGKKKWISFGHSADLFLLFAKVDGQIGAFIVERGTPGFSSKPITGLLGFRGSMIAELTLKECRIPAENLIGRVGFGLALVANHGLSNGRYSTAWGALGLAQACLEACIKYASERKQFDVYLKEHQFIQQMIAEMVSNIMASKLLCFRASQLRDQGDETSILEIAVEKNFSATTAFAAANNAVQIHGANGCSADYPVQRFMRDAKVMEIVEGSTQIQQIIISNGAFKRFRKRK